MAEYYISAQNGNDGNDGLSPETAWATLTRATQVTSAPAGSMFYIGPGLYVEKITISTTGGTVGSPIEWVPDPNAEHFPNDNPGLVIIGAVSPDEEPIVDNTIYTTVSNITFGSKHGRAYVYGSNWSGTGVYVSCYRTAGGTTGQKIVNLVLHGNIGVGMPDGIAEDCIAITKGRGFECDEAYRCLSVCAGGISDEGFFAVDAYNCITVGPGGFTMGGDTSIARNCLAIGANYGFQDYVAENCIALACKTGYRGCTVKNSKAFYCVTPEQLSVSLTNFSTRPWSLPEEAPLILWDPKELVRAFDPVMMFAFDDGDDSLDAGPTDILGRARRMGRGRIDIGPYEWSQEELDHAVFHTEGPSIKFTGVGQRIFEVPVKVGAPVSAAVQVKFSNSPLKPRLLLRGEGITEQVAEAAGDGLTWEGLAVNAVPSKNTLLQLILDARTRDQELYLMPPFTGSLAQVEADDSGLYLGLTGGTSSAGTSVESFEGHPARFHWKNAPENTMNWELKVDSTDGNSYMSAPIDYGETVILLGPDVSAAGQCTFSRRGGVTGSTLWLEGYNSGTSSWEELWSFTGYPPSTTTWYNEDVQIPSGITQLRFRVTTNSNSSNRWDVDNISVENAVVAEGYTSGSYEVTLDASSLAVKQSSVLSWDEYVPAGASVVLETSVDNGLTWQTPTNGGAVPGLVDATSSIRVRVGLTSPSDRESPVFRSMRLEINTGAVAWFSDLSVAVI